MATSEKIMATKNGKSPLPNTPPPPLPKENILAQLQVYWLIVRQGWWIILLPTVAAVIIAVSVTAVTPKVFRSTARYIISPTSEIDPTDLLRSLDTLDRSSIVATYAEVFGSQHIRSEAIKKLGWSSAEASGYEVSAVNVPDTNVVALSVEGPQADRAQILALTMGELSTEFVQDLYVLYDITLLDPARIPTNPISPNPTRDAGIAAVLGLVAGVALAVLRSSHLFANPQPQTADN